MNENNNNPIDQELAPNKELFKEIIQTANLPAAKIKQELPNLTKE
ncbi:MAG: hypothetical protein NY202_03040 [Mollicutes bacterium UO1]